MQDFEWATVCMRLILTRMAGRIHDGIKWYSGELPKYVEVDICHIVPCHKFKPTGFDCLDYFHRLFLRGTSHCDEDT